MSDKGEPCEAAVVAVVSLENLLFYVIGLKRMALNNNDKDLFESADRIEQELKLLMNKNTIFERW